MSRRNKKLNKNRIRNVIIVAIIAVFLIVVYRFGFLTKTEPVVTAVFTEQGTERTPLTASLTINQDTDGRYYVLLPDKVQSYKTSRFIKNATEEDEEETEGESGGPRSVEEPQGTTRSLEPTRSIPSETVVDKNDIQDSEVENTNTESIVENIVVEESNKKSSESNEENILENTNTVLETRKAKSGEEANENVVENTTKGTENVSNEISNTVAENTVETQNTVGNTVKEDDKNDKKEENVVNEISNTVDTTNTVENTIANEVNETKIENTISNTTVDEIPEELPTRSVKSATPLRGESSGDSTEYLPSTKYYLSEDEYENKAINLGVVYSTKVVIDGDSILTLYNQELENTITSTGTVITVSGFIPYDHSIHCINMQSTVSTYIAEDDEYENASMELAYDISIVGANGIEYEPYNYSETVKVKIVSDSELAGKLDGRDVWLRHFVLRESDETGEEELVDEKVTIATKKGNTIEFITDEFSPYAVFSFDPVLPESVTIDDYESDKNYYIGLNYTENGVGRTGNDIYKEGENLASVKVNYYSYDYLEEPLPVSKYFEEGTWTTTETTPYYDSNEYQVGSNNILVQSFSRGEVSGRYYNEIVFSFSADRVLDMTEDDWRITFDFQNTNNTGFDANTTRTANRGITFTLSNNAQTLTISGNSMAESGWQAQGTYYTLDVFFYFRNIPDRDYLTNNNYRLDPNFVLGHNVFVGYKSTFTTSIQSPNVDLDQELDWTLSFNVPNAEYFLAEWLPTLNPDKQFTHNFTSPRLIIEGDTLGSDGWVINGDTYTYSFTIIYSIDTKISSLPENYYVRAITRPISGKISADPNEGQFLMSYIKCMPIVNGSISFDLIDNPYMDRPAGYGFDGWISHETYNITINDDTKVQTLTYDLEGETEAEINLYVDWQPANIIYYSQGSGTYGDGSSRTFPTNSWADACYYMKRSYKRAHNASDRELNIIVFFNGNLTNWNTTENGDYSYTITSLYDGVDYRNRARITNVASVNNTRQLTFTSDMQIDFVNLAINNYAYNDGTGNIQTYIVGNTYNIRIGRGVIPYTNLKTGTISQVQGGPNDRVIRSEYRLVIESGYYQNVQVGRANLSREYRAFGTLIFGSDYDRICGDRISSTNTGLKVYNRLSSRTSTATAREYNGNPLYLIDVKSGQIGIDYFTPRAGEYAFAGIYVGGHGSASTDYGKRMVIVEGGEVANIIGGISSGESYNTNSPKTFIYVKGGSVQNIVGGAGVSTTYGDRYIQVTGGEVVYSVAGGSNGIMAGTSGYTHASYTGQLDGQTIVYIGGTAEIGTAGTSNSLYGATAGSVFGAGLGNNSKNTSGQVIYSHVIVDGEAIIHNNVYGGGNYGTVGESENIVAVSYSVENTNLNGNSYVISNTNNLSSGNSLSANSTSVTNSTYSTAAYPTANQEWTFENVSGNTYRIKNANGNYLEGYTYSQFGRTYNALRLSNNPTTFTIGNPGNSGVTISYNMGGTRYVRYSNGNWSSSSTYTTLYLLKANEAVGSELDPATTIDIIGGTVIGSVYGGANDNGSVANAKTIRGSTVVNMKGGTVNEAVYGGCNTSGTVLGSSMVTITGGTIGTTASNSDVVFGGGRGSGTVINQKANVNITDEDDDVNLFGSVYGGSALGSITGRTNVTIKDIFSEENTITSTGDIYGGGKGSSSTAARSSGAITVSVDGGSFPNTKVFGGCNINGNITNNVLVKIGEENATFVNQVYGGGNQANISNTALSDKVYIYENGTVTEAFNGGNQAGIAGNCQRGLYIQGGTVLEGAYGGSNSSGTLEYTYVECSDGATAKNVYGGGKGNGTLVSGNTEVVIKGSTNITDSVYGGGEGETARVNGNTSVKIDENSTVDVNVYGGGNAGPTQGSTKVEIDAATIEGNVFGGGKGSTATVSTNSDVDILTGALIKGNVYGGGDAGPLTRNTDVYVESTVNGNVFGGGKGSTAIVGGDTATLIEGASITNTSDSTDVGNVYGGGDQGKVNGSTTVSIVNSTVKNQVYGGGNQADITYSTSVSLTNGSTATTVFGGGNAGKVGTNTAVSLDSATVTGNVYGGGNEGDVTGNPTVTVMDSTVANSIFGGGKAANTGSTTVSVLNTGSPNNYTSKYVYGGGDQGELIGSTRVTVTNAKIENDIYGGGNGAANQLGTTVPGKVTGNTYVKLKDATSGNVFGGGNGKTAVVSNNTEVYVEDSELVYTEGDTITGHVFGGGNNGPVDGTTKVGLTNATVAESAYAAGNGTTAIVAGNPYIYADGSTTIGKSIFGGGNAALTGDSLIPTPDTDDNHPYESRYITAIVDIAGATIGQNVYGGANSSVIQGNTVVNIGVEAIEEFYDSDIGQRFTKGKAEFIKDKIDIAGTIFGGGESMDPTKPFNYDTVSVLGTININVNGEGYDEDEDTTIRFHKSIFGSGNASRATGRTKTIHIKNYGNIDEPKQGVSLQRATDVIVDNSTLWLSGTTDSTSAHPDGFFTLNQIKALKLKNNGILYLRNGAHKLASYYSLVDNPTTGEEEVETVDIIDKITGANGATYYAKNGLVYNNAGTEVRYRIEDGKIIDANSLEVVTTVQSVAYADTLTKNVDNRIYIYSGINLNISDDDDASADYGEVHGMTFFGLYRNAVENSGEGTGEGGETSGAGTEFNEGDVVLYKGMFDEEYNVGQSLQWEERNYTRSYVLGLHKTPEHDISKDGFYTNFERFEIEIPNDVSIEEGNFYDYSPTTYTGYITPIPENDIYYMWYAGPDQDVYYYSFNLTASKHSTLGTKEQPLTGLSFPNATLTIRSVESDLMDGVGLYNKNTIPNINLNQEEANSRFGLTMKSSTSGWSMVGSTDLFSENNAASYTGTSLYKIENSSTTPSLSFYFYHSNNITEQQELGYYTIRMRLEYRKDALNRGYADVIIDIMLLTEVYNDLGFNGAITPGVQYDLFTSTPTNITSKSSFSTYFELAQDHFYDKEQIHNFYSNSYRVITTEYPLPLNTTITMIDRYNHNNPKYYYYVVTANDVASGKNEFRLSDFIVMGSTDETYDEMEERNNYYIDSLGYEYENFIFITNFENAVFTDPPDEDGAITKDQHFRIYLKAEVEGREEILFGLLDDQIGSLKYGIYDTESTIKIDAELSRTKIYLGNDAVLNVDTRYDITVVAGSRVHDTRFFDKKLGTKLTFYYKNDDDEWDVVKGSELLGLYFELDGIKYYPSADGTTRIKIADLVSNASSAIKIGTENCSIDSNRYRIKVESFGSADGMYYGIEASDYTYVYLEIINDVYGLDVRIEPQQAVIDTSTGKVLEGNVENIGYIAAEEHKLNFTVDYLSGLSNPYITISLYRRLYNDVYDNAYEKVDLQDYVQETLQAPIEADRSIYSTEEDAEFLDSIKQFEYEYKAFDTAKIALAVGDDNTESVTFDDLMLTLKDTLRTGTYKIEFMLYDTYDDVATNIITDNFGNNTAKNYNITTYEYIGESYTYIIIK